LIDFSKRLTALRELIKKEGLDALYVSFPPNVAYFTGTSGSDCFLYINSKDAYIITDFRYREMAQALRHLKYIEISISYNAIDFIKEQSDKNIGFEKNSLVYSQYLKLSSIDEKNFIPTENIVEGLREVKDQDEIENTKKACEIACKAFDHMIGIIKPGLTELELAAELEYFMRKSGAEGMSFDTILISGAKTSLPHGVPSKDFVREGSFVLMDYGCKYNGYCSDMTRTVAVGKPSEEMVKVYNIVLEAQLKCCENIKAGILGCDAHKIASDIIENAGYGEYFGHGLGHGTGLEIHEAPRYSPSYKKVIKENTIVSIEPGIYLPKKFGVRIEDLALVEKTGIINFVTAPKELLII